jgi:RNA polymerase sigma-70 factor (ECF subfamily)
MTFISKRKKENTFSFEENEEAEKKNNSIKNTLKSDEDFDGDEIQLKLQTAIGLLPDKQKIVFTMRYYDEIKYEEMAEILHTSVGALKASYHHAVKKIEEYLKND